MKIAWMMTYIFLGIFTLISLSFIIFAAIRNSEMEELAFPNPNEENQQNE